MKLSKGQRISVYAWVVLLILPYTVYFYARAAGYLPSESDWWSQGINHGPWRWRWQMLFILPSIYIFILGSIALFLVGVVSSIKYKSKKNLGVYCLLSLLYLGSFYLHVSSLFWTID